MACAQVRKEINISVSDDFASGLGLVRKVVLSPLVHVLTRPSWEDMWTSESVAACVALEAAHRNESRCCEFFPGCGPVASR